MTSAAASTPDSAWVLDEEHVRRALRALIARRTHPHFLAYLHLRQVAARTAGGGLVDLRPIWSEVSEVLRVPDAPIKKPYLRPFQAKANREDEYYWLNDNIAGSYAPSSMRAGNGGLGTVFDLQADGRFALRPDHAQAAVRTLLYEVPMPAEPLAAFLLRDYGIVDVPLSGPPVGTLVQLFRQEYGLTDDAEFSTVYDLDEGWNPKLNAIPGRGFRQVPLAPESDGLT